MNMTANPGPAVRVRGLRMSFQRESLSAREAEVLQLVARGMTNADMRRRLFISEATVKTHLLRAFGKLGVSDRTAAVTTAIERG
jgi:DNA-binding CsgD family transcriptional regulator